MASAPLPLDIYKTRVPGEIYEDRLYHKLFAMKETPIKNDANNAHGTVSEPAPYDSYPHQAHGTYPPPLLDKENPLS